MRSRRRVSTMGVSGLIGLLVFLCFCLSAVWVWFPGSGTTPPTVQANGSQDLSARLAEHRGTLEELIAVTGERPLFQADRRPVAAPEAPAPAAEAVLVLVGILVDGEERLALVRRSTSEQLFQIEAGGRLGPWQIVSVDVASISVLKDDGSTFTLRIDG